MRTTIDIPIDLHTVLSSLATSNRKSLSQTAVGLMQRGLQAQLLGTANGRSASPSLSASTGLPRVQFPRVISAEDVRALEDEA